jgi:hypothetical protein
MGTTAWQCGACGFDNTDGLVCAACGVARRYVEDPPLDLPYAPRWSELPSLYAGLLWGMVSVVGLALVLAPGWRASLGLGTPFILFGLASSLAAAFTASTTAWWDRHFNEVELELPQTVRSGQPFRATLRLVPYDRVASAHVRFALRDNFYARGANGSVETRSRTLERQLALAGEPLSGRRLHEAQALFVGPFPASRHTDIVAEVMASLYGALAFVVPGLGLAARNLREHGGYYVEATVRVGWMRRTIKRRVIAFHLGEDLFVG